MILVIVVNGKQVLVLLYNQVIIYEFFDVVILDYEMFGMIGMELVVCIKEDIIINNDFLVMMFIGLGMVFSVIVV